MAGQLTEKEYRSLEALSGTGFLPLALGSPKHYKYFKENPTPPTPAMKHGSLLHALVLENADKHYLPMPKGMKRSGAEYKALLTDAQSKDLIVVTYKDWQAALGAREEAFREEHVRKILEVAGETEVPMVWEEDGVKCKGKPDRYLPELNVLIDYKSCPLYTAGPKKFWRKVLSFEYRLQLAHYQSGKRILTGADSVPEFIIIAQEVKAPYVAQAWEIPQQEIDEAHKIRKELMEIYKNAYDNNDWHGYSKNILVLEREYY